MKRALIFAHYDADRLVGPHVRYYLSHLRKHVAHLIFVSTSAHLSEIKSLENICDFAVTKNNTGYDFASWKYGLEFLAKKETFDEIIFANDSVYAPLYPMDNFFKTAEGFTSAFWGATSNNESSAHIQSFFFAFRKQLIREGVFSNFWDGVADIEDKNVLIQQYEVGLSKKILGCGYDISSVFNPDNLRLMDALNGAFIDPKIGLINSARRILRTIKSRGKPRSPMHFYWQSVIDSGVPMLKVELLRNNPCKLDLAPIWLMLSKNPELLDYITQHLNRVKQERKINESCR